MYGGKEERRGRFALGLVKIGNLIGEGGFYFEKGNSGRKVR
jgi:hypothetical protein